MKLNWPKKFEKRNIYNNWKNKSNIERNQEKIPKTFKKN